jgi:uncharacterized protein (TIGR04255 family)
MEKKIFPRNLLKSVVLQVSFNNPITVTGETVKKLFDSLPYEKKEYKEETVKKYEFKVDKGNESLNISQLGKSGIYLVHDFDYENKFILDPEKFTLSVSKYERFKSFFENFLKGFDALQTVNKVVEYKRIGLRYINVFSLEDEDIKGIADWKEFINPAFIPNYASINVQETELSLRRNMNRFYFGDGDAFINVYLGLWNNGFPGKITEKEFILDLDCYVDNKIMNDKDIQEIPLALNEKAYKCFVSLITNKLQERLESK